MTDRMTAQEFNKRVESGEIQIKSGKYAAIGSKTKSKYRNKITELDGRKFDSAAEANYYKVLKQQKATGLIKDFECQKRYVIADAIYNDDGTLYARQIDYIADFVVAHLDGGIEVIDVKGMVLDLYKLKKSMMFHRYGIKITEIKKAKRKPQERTQQDAN